MKIKVDADGHAVLQDGMPVYVHDDGKEAPFDAAGTVARIRALNAEAKGHREAREAAEAKLAGFAGIDDPAAAVKALATVRNLGDQQLVAAGEVEKIKTEAIKAVEEKYRPIVKERDALQQSLVREKIGGSFARSKFIAEKLAIPADMVEAAFGRHFALDGDRIVATDATGNRLFSRTNPGELAGFDEAMEMIVSAYPQRDAIMRGTGASGSGAQGGGGNGAKRTVTRAQFEAMPHAERAAIAKDAAAGKAAITD